MYIKNLELNPRPSGLERSVSANCGTACHLTSGYNAGFESKMLEKMRKDVVLAQFELLSRHALGGTQQRLYKTPRSSKKKGAIKNC